MIGGGKGWGGDGMEEKRGKRSENEEKMNEEGRKRKGKIKRRQKGKEIERRGRNE